MINAFVKGLTRERLSRFEPEDVKDDSWTPAFLVGFPRSGTTMTEQILAAHSGIVTTDEQAYVATVRNEWARIVNSNPDVGLAADQLEAKDILTLRKAYRDLVEADQDTAVTVSPPPSPRAAAVANQERRSRVQSRLPRGPNRKEAAITVVR